MPRHLFNSRLSALSLLLAAAALPALTQGAVPPPGPLQAPRVLSPINNARAIRLAPGVATLARELPAVQAAQANTVLEDIKGARIAHVPYQLMDPKTRKIVGPSDNITLPDGRVVPAGAYYSQLNALEAWLNGVGQSLKNKQPMPVVRRTIINATLLNSQSKAVGGFHRVLPKIDLQRFKPTAAGTPVGTQLQSMVSAGDAQKLGLSPQQYQDGLKGLAAANLASVTPLHLAQAATLPAIKSLIKVPLKTSAISSATATSVSKASATSATGATSAPGASSVTGASAVSKASATSGSSTIAAASGIRPSHPIHQAFPFNFEFGNAGTFQAYLRGKATIDGVAYGVANPPTNDDLNNGQSHFAFHGDATAGGSVFNRGFTLATANADFTTSSKLLSAKMDISVLGQSIFHLNESAPGHWERTQKFAKGCDVNTTIPIPIGPITLSVKMGVQGEAGLEYGMAIYGGLPMVRGWVDPYVHSSVYAQAGIGIGGDWLGLSAGVGANMTLLNNDLSISGEVGVMWFLNFGIREKFTIHNKLEMLSGRVYAFTTIGHPCFPDVWNACPTTITVDVWNWPGIRFEGDLIAIDASRPLPPM